MFEDIEYLNKKEFARYDIYTYHITHRFADRRVERFLVSFTAPSAHISSLYSRAAAIIHAYNQQRMNVSANLAHWLSFKTNPQSAVQDLHEYMGDYFPSLEYVAKYEKCVRRHLDIIFSKKK